MGKYINCSTELRSHIMKTCGLSPAGFWKIMRFKSSSDNAIRIRRYAVEHGGKLADSDFMPNCRTTHNADGTMIQDFGWGVSLLVDFKSSTIAVCKNSKVVEIHEQVTVSGWGDLTREAQTMAERRAAEMISR